LGIRAGISSQAAATAAARQGNFWLHHRPKSEITPIIIRKKIRLILKKRHNRRA